MGTNYTAIGNLTADPELRFTSAGKPWLSFCIAQSERRLNKTTNTWEDSEPWFLNCALWGQGAEPMSESLTKGTRIMAVGRLQSRSYENKSGQTVRTVELLADEVAPSLRFATAKPATMKRTGPANNGAPNDDPWAASPTDPPF
jgi:single-strand DNA-binding protein